MRTTIPLKWAVVAFCLVVFLLIYLSRRIDDEISGRGQGPHPRPAAPAPSVPSDQKSSTDTAPKEIVRIERKPPDQAYIENIIFVDGVETARFKSKDDKIFDRTGMVPDAKIKFVNEWENTYGVEQYRDGKRDGEYIEYYGNGQIRTKANYSRGRLMDREGYFLNGTLRMREDYRNTEWVSGLISLKKVKDVGVGKIYRADGTLKYEWSFVDDDQRNHTKTYDPAGDLQAADYYDTHGELLEHWEAPR